MSYFFFVRCLGSGLIHTRLTKRKPTSDFWVRARHSTWRDIILTTSFVIILFYVDCIAANRAIWYFESCIVFTQAYPNWEWHSEASSGDILTTPTPNCSSLISVFRVRADRCNRLWVLDSGVMDSIETFKTVCPPKLLVFDMRTDRVVSVLFYCNYFTTKLTLSPR